MRPRRIAAENIAHAAGNLCLVAEELADVTQAAWAPAGWSIATRKDRYQGLTIIGASQRPAAIDRHFFGKPRRFARGGLTSRPTSRVSRERAAGRENRDPQPEAPAVDRARHAERETHAWYHTP